MFPAVGDLEVKEVNDKANLHPIFTRNPSDWMKLINNQVEVKMEDGCAHVGYVYTVDPVSDSIVLISNVEEALTISSSLNMKLLIGASVTSVDVISNGSENVKQLFEKLFRPVSNESLDTEELNARKQRLKSWLEKHRLPVTLSGPDEKYLTVADALTVQPPYTEESCLSANEIILSRIQGLIKNMPADHETW